jgi:GNAT superfamily N-acetyltransferase
MPEPGAEKRLILLACEKDEVLGYLCLYLDADPRRGALLDNLHTHPDHKGRGHGSALIARAANWVLAKRPQSGLYLWVYEQNYQARRFYEKLGGTTAEKLFKKTVEDKQVATLRYVWTEVKPLTVMSRIIFAEGENDLRQIRELFLEYADSLGVDLEFQNFKQEVADLPGDYASPRGRLFLVLSNSLPAGCGALRAISSTVCEMKRLYVRPPFRGSGLGKLLAERIIQEARKIGYDSMLLDTLPTMTQARQLYAELGFQETQPYRFNPVRGTAFMSLDLKNPTGKTPQP